MAPICSRPCPSAASPGTPSTARRGPDWSCLRAVDVIEQEDTSSAACLICCAHACASAHGIWGNAWPSSIWFSFPNRTGTGTPARPLLTTRPINNHPTRLQPQGQTPNINNAFSSYSPPMPKPRLGHPDKLRTASRDNLRQSLSAIYRTHTSIKSLTSTNQHCFYLPPNRAELAQTPILHCESCLPQPLCRQTSKGLTIILIKDVAVYLQTDSWAHRNDSGGLHNNDQN